MKLSIASFQKIIWSYYRANRRAMPWRETHNPYRILISEIMLQQTQVERVKKYYGKFLREFPTFQSLAKAPVSRVLSLWQGLGYNRRALHVKHAAEEIVRTYKGVLPRDPALLIKLPGIGKATAGSLLAFVYNARTPFIETNIRRVYLRFFFPKKKNVSDEAILLLVADSLPARNVREWYYALMDYGAYLADTEKNHNMRSSHYRPQSKFKGSRREARGKIVRTLALEGRLPAKALQKKTELLDPIFQEALEGLIKEGLLRKSRNGVLSLAP